MNALATASAPNTGVNGVALTVLIVLFLAVTVMGFLATRWRKAESMESLDEWGLGGRGFGTWVTWFLLGGDLYTAYTFIAVPAAMFALGSVSGFFAVPYTIVVYPIIFVFMSRLWSVSHRHGYVTRPTSCAGATARAGCRWRSRSPASWRRCPTSPCSWSASRPSWRSSASVATAPWLADLPLFIAFAVLAAYTYSSGLRAPALIAFVKDALIYLVIIVAVIYLPTKYGGWGHIFDSAQTKMATTNPATGKPTGAFIPAPDAVLGLRHPGPRARRWRCSCTRTRSRPCCPPSRRNDDPAQRRDPAGVQLRAGPAGPARLGRDRGRHQADRAGRPAQRAAGHPPAVRGRVPVLVRRRRLRRRSRSARSCRPRSCRSPRQTCSPATSTASGCSPNATVAQEAKVGKLVSLLVKFVALIFVLTMDKQNAINFQLLGGIWILQTLPVGGVRALHPLVPPVGAAGRLGRRDGLRHASRPTTSSSPTVPHFAGSLAPMELIGQLGYIAFTAFVINVIVAAVLTPILRALKSPEGDDRTVMADYFVDAGDPRVKPLPELTTDQH